MLLTKEVEITLSNAIVEYYERKGYNIPRHINKNGRLQVKRGTTIVVKTSDLSEGSNVLVDCSCDECKNTYTMPYIKYLKSNHNGKTYCKECFHKVLLSGENHWNWNDKMCVYKEKNRKGTKDIKCFIYWN